MAHQHKLSFFVAPIHIFQVCSAFVQLTVALISVLQLCNLCHWASLRWRSPSRDAQSSFVDDVADPGQLRDDLSSMTWVCLLLGHSRNTSPRRHSGGISIRAHPLNEAL